MDRFFGQKKLTFLFLTLSVLSLWAFYSWYIYRLFENVRFFSHLSDFEREMTYRTEMGLYFSFYKTLVLSPTFMDGLNELMADNVTEFGHTINALQRFNLYPEVLLSGAFRLYKSFSKNFGITDQVCWRVNRGDMPPIESCEGLGNYHYFYIYGVFLIAGSVLPSLFLGSIFISQSYFGGLLTICAFMFNHGEATRVQWTPPLRESFAYPIFLVQMILLASILRKEKISLFLFILITLLITAFCAFWQLSHFIISTQLASLVLLFSLEMISLKLMFTLWKMFLISFCLALLLLFGNSMLLNSLFLSSLLSIVLLLILRPLLLDRIHLRPLFVFLHLIIHSSATIFIKLCFQYLFNFSDDNNVLDLLKSKLLHDFATFHTRLYTCAPEFDFISLETIQKLTATWLLPTFGFSLFIWLIISFKGSGLFLWRGKQNEEVKLCPELAYHFVQLFFFLLMASLVMRLKLFATPQLCLVSSLLANSKLMTTTFNRPFGIYCPILIGFLLAGMANQGWKNMREQIEMRGEYSNPEQEDLFLWVQQQTPKDAVFAGTMALMANLKLSTLRPIVNHPHYESEEIRNRTLRVYSIYSRKPLKEVHSTLRSMGIHFYVFQPQQCLQSHPKSECTYLAMWDLEDPGNRNRPSLCHKIWTGIQSGDDGQSLLQPFWPVYSTPNYVVLAVT